MTADFAEHFWQFIREGGYRPEKRKQEEGETPKYELYRFVNGKPEYPEMIELLSRHPDILGEPKGLIVEPLPVDEETSSLTQLQHLLNKISLKISLFLFCRFSLGTTDFPIPLN